ncbi:hypothetical protein B0T19DRAFT_425842 [Cercophora scortea]|uniref:Uncharacterized protein n=1 Tax=Cercophora scortea TaxID=314031 RepID=A0AAE0IE92_9PEZI|nr:hypothetical protein B0T19DRAFT_425842 [Cercophora scortea]
MLPRPCETTLTHTSFPAKKMKVDELIALGGAVPPTPSSPPSSHVVDEITRLYHEVYVPGLALFFESRWYNFKKDQTAFILGSNPSLVALFASFLQNIVAIKSTDPADMVYAGHLETCIIWALATLPRYMPSEPSELIPVEDGQLEARNRLYVLETLLSGGLLSSNPLPPPVGNSSSKVRRNELEFWHHLGQFLLVSQSSTSHSDCLARERSLNQMRSLLDGRENRDVLYSMAVLREYSAQWDAALNEQTVPTHLEETDPHCKLAVATRFIRDESASTGGTTNVVRRFADLAYRAFVRPGVNVDLRKRS